jgi:hypothetical protein
VGRTQRPGRVALLATGAFGLADLTLAHSPWFALSLLAAASLGGADALATSIRHAAVQIETPDELRGRVSSIYQISSRGGPAVGDAVIGGAAVALGPTLALTVGAGLTLAYVGSLLTTSNSVRSYTGPNLDVAAD